MNQKIKIIAIAACAAFIPGCGKVQSFVQGTPPGPKLCSVTQTASGAQITCPDGSTASVSNGQNGAAGQDAKISTAAATSAQCAAGEL